MMIDLQQVAQAAMAPLEDARSLPFAVYTDPSMLAAEAQTIFAHDWVFVCMAGELSAPGDYYALQIAGEPVVVLRAEDGELRALSNVCRHRGTLLLEDGFGTVDKYITCPYHAWAYDHQGALQAIPFNEQIAVDRDQHSLPRWQIALWNGLVFVNLDTDAPPLSQRLAGIDQYLSLFQPERFKYVSSGDREIWQSNWKLAIENAVESYHLFKVHAQTLEQISPTKDAYCIAGSSEWSLTGGATLTGTTLTGTGEQANELHSHYVLVALPPSFVGILSYGYFGWLSAHPIDAGQTLIRSGSTQAQPAGSMGGSSEFTKAFFKEDQDMCERVQRGMSAQRTHGGKLVDMERVVVDFHQFLGTRLSGSAATNLFEDQAAARWRAASAG